MKNLEEDLSFIDKLPDNVKVIKPDALVDIKMSFAFFERVRQVYNYLLDGKTPEELIKIQNELLNGTEEPYLNHLRTVMTIINEFQKQAEDTEQTMFISKEKIIEQLNQTQEKISEA